MKIAIDAASQGRRAAANVIIVGPQRVEGL
jgi:hypothetical protein